MFLSIYRSCCSRSQHPQRLIDRIIEVVQRPFFRSMLAFVSTDIVARYIFSNVLFFLLYFLITGDFRLAFRIRNKSNGLDRAFIFASVRSRWSRLIGQYYSSCTLFLSVSLSLSSPVLYSLCKKNLPFFSLFLSFTCFSSSSSLLSLTLSFPRNTDSQSKCVNLLLRIYKWQERNIYVHSLSS